MIFKILGSIKSKLGIIYMGGCYMYMWYIKDIYIYVYLCMYFWKYIR